MSQRSCSGSIYCTNYALVDTDEVSDATPTTCWLISTRRPTLHRRHVLVNIDEEDGVVASRIYTDNTFTRRRQVRRPSRVAPHLHRHYAPIDIDKGRRGRAS